MAAQLLTPRCATMLAGGLAALLGLSVLALQSETYKAVRERALGIVSQLSPPRLLPTSWWSTSTMPQHCTPAAGRGHGTNRHGWSQPSRPPRPRAIALDIVLSGKCGDADARQCRTWPKPLAKVPTVIGFVLPGRDSELPVGLARRGKTACRYSISLAHRWRRTALPRIHRQGSRPCHRVDQRRRQRHGKFRSRPWCWWEKRSIRASPSMPSGYGRAHRQPF